MMFVKTCIHDSTMVAAHICLLNTFLTSDIIIINLTTKVFNPCKVSAVSDGSQKSLSSQSLSWLFKKFTKLRSSDQVGFGTPQFLTKAKKL